MCICAGEARVHRPRAVGHNVVRGVVRYAFGPGSFCHTVFICLPHDCLPDGLAEVFFVFMSFHLSPRWLLSWMPWPDHFAKALLAIPLCVRHTPALLDHGFEAWMMWTQLLFVEHRYEALSHEYFVHARVVWTWFCCGLLHVELIDIDCIAFSPNSFCMFLL